jgi:hypothetical protein
MSRSSSRLLTRRPKTVVAALAAVLLVSGATAAGMLDQARAAGKTRPTPVESMARIPDDAPRSVLKCWQEGRLVFESSGVTSEAAAAAARTFKGANGRSVHLLDLRHGLCILERSDG